MSSISFMCNVYSFRLIVHIQWKKLLVWKKNPWIKKASSDGKDVRWWKKSLLYVNFFSFYLFMPFIWILNLDPINMEWKPYKWYQILIFFLHRYYQPFLLSHLKILNSSRFEPLSSRIESFWVDWTTSFTYMPIDFWNSFLLQK